MKKFQKILIASRGEIAVRIIRTCKDMGIRTVAFYSQADTDALHVNLKEEDFVIGDYTTDLAYKPDVRNKLCT
jgi:acetyl-CoA carboxylase, biotin carboxylase subunit